MTALFQKLLHYIGAQINGSEVQRAAFVCWMAFVAYFFLFLWCAESLLFDFHPGISTSQMQFMLIWSAAVNLGNLLLGACHWRLTQQSKLAHYYALTVICFYTFTTMTTCFLVGSLNIITGMVMMNAPMIGLILFPPLIVATSFILGVIYLLLLSALQVAGSISFTPLFAGPPNYYITLISILGSAFYVFYEVVIMACLIRAWKDRESGVKHLSLTDALTGVANRRHILELLELEFAERRGDSQHLGVIMVDIDHFKKINDTHGHQTGDEVLQAAASALRACLRQQDHIGRYGGEEFLILLPATSAALAEQIAERCRRTIDELVLPARPTLALTASLGVASHPKQQSRDVDWLIQQADSAMYEAKKLGRNRVVSSTELLPTG